MPGTSVRYTGHGRRSVEILRDGRVIREMDIKLFCDLDSELRDCAAQAMARQGECISVPSRSYARGNRSRNYGAMGVAQ
jgi:hypothetical protein